MSKKKKKRTNKKSGNQAKSKKSSVQKADAISASSSADHTNNKAEQTQKEVTQNKPEKTVPEPPEDTANKEKPNDSNPAKPAKAFDGPKKLPVPKRRTPKGNSKPVSRKKSSESPKTTTADSPKKAKETTGNSPFIVVPEKSEDKIEVTPEERKSSPKSTKKPTTPPPSGKPTTSSDPTKTVSKTQKPTESKDSKHLEKASEKTSKKANTKKPTSNKKPASTNEKTEEPSSSNDAQLDKPAEQEPADVTKVSSQAASVLAALDKIEAPASQEQDSEEKSEEKTVGANSSAEQKPPASSSDDTNDDGDKKQAATANTDTASQSDSKKDDSEENTEIAETNNAEDDTDSKKNQTIAEDKTTKKSISIAPAPVKDSAAEKSEATEDAQAKTTDAGEESTSKLTDLHVAPSSKRENSTTIVNEDNQEEDATTSIDDSKEALEEKPKAKSEKVQELRSKFQNSSPRRRYLITTAAVILGFYVVLTSAWAFDSARHSDRAPRGTHIGSVNVSGMQEADIKKETEKFAAQLDKKIITLKADDASVEVSPKQLGATVDTEALTAAAFEDGSKGFLPVRPVKWLGTVFSAKSVVTPEYNIDEKKLIELTDELLGSQIDGPKEPGIALINNKLDATPGESGKEIVTTSLLGDVESAISQGAPATITLPTTVAEPKVTLETAKKLASEADKVTDEPIALTALDQKIQVSPKTLKKWIAVAEVDEKQTWIIDQEVATDELNSLFGELGVTEEEEEEEADDGEAKKPLTPKFTVVNNKPILLPVADTITCCDDTTADKIKEILLSEPSAPEEVVFPEYETMAEQCKKGETRGNVETSDEVIRRGEIDVAFLTKDPEYEKLNSYGIIEEISTCTTAYVTYGNRVVNIQNFADAMHAKVIAPQSQISLNEEVGRRTRAKGYLPAGAINGGSSTNDEVGGGVSQFATTFFNASFFGGLDLIAFKPHSQKFENRYPHTLESTISWGGPEVISGNPTDHGVLVWTEYTADTITVTFYSTKTVEVEALPTKKWTKGLCQMGSIERTIDGEKDSKKVLAEYRPNGFDCNGNPSAAKLKELAEQEAARQPQPVTTLPAAPNPNPNTPPSNPFFEN